MKKMGLTDSGEPLHMVVLILKSNLILEPSKNKAVILLNNGIHAGEPDGIDASMQLFRDLALGKIKAPKTLLSFVFQSIILVVH
jgi:hypothetical protein